MYSRTSGDFKINKYARKKRMDTRLFKRLQSRLYGHYKFRGTSSKLVANHSCRDQSAIIFNLQLKDNGFIPFSRRTAQELMRRNSTGSRTQVFHFLAPSLYSLHHLLTG